MLTTSLHIRVATPEDAALIADLSRSTFFDTFEKFNTQSDMDKFMSEQFSTMQLIAETGEPGNIFLLAYNENNPVGYARLREDNNPPELNGLSTLEIARIYAIKEMIGKGVGKELMNASMAIGRQKFKQWIWLGVWEKNQRAIDFYIAHGFEKFSEHPFILGDDVQTDWLMKKKI